MTIKGWRLASLIVAAAAPIAGHISLVLGRGYGWALALCALQAMAVGVAFWQGARRWLGVLAAVSLLGGLAFGFQHSPERAVLVEAGLIHALLYGCLLVVFARSLSPGRISVVTQAARRMNPAFHAGMVPYTRAVAWAWCLFFAAQLAGSAILLALDPRMWRLLVTGLHGLMVLGFALAEYLVRRWRWRHEHYTGLLDTLRGMRRMMRP